MKRISRELVHPVEYSIPFAIEIQDLGLFSDVDYFASFLASPYIDHSIGKHFAPAIKSVDTLYDHQLIPNVNLMVDKVVDSKRGHNLSTRL